MKVIFIKKPTQEDWNNVKDSALTTMGLQIKNLPDSKWKKMILLSEHSPIRDLCISWKWEDLNYWVSVHLVRHNIGVNSFVKSQRPDRNKNIVDRDAEPQGNFVTHKATMNAQAIINVSKKRLCYLASEKTRLAWQMFVDELKNIEPELAELCVPNCIYRNGLCGEPASCGYNKTEKFYNMLNIYSQLFL